MEIFVILIFIGFGWWTIDYLFFSTSREMRNEEIKRRKEREESNERRKTEIENTKSLILEILDNLDEKNKRGQSKWSLEQKIKKSYLIDKALDELVDEKIVFVDNIHSFPWYQSKIGREKVEKAEKEKKEKAKVAKDNRRNNLIEKYGEEFGLAIFSKKVLNDMDPEMVIDSLGEPKYKDSDKWYYGTKKSFKKFIEFKNNKVVGESKCDGVWLDMPLELLIASMGKPADEKKNVTKKGTKTKLYFGARKTRQKTTVYKLEVRLEDDVVVGFRELE